MQRKLVQAVRSLGFERMGAGFGKLGASSPRKRAIDSLSNTTNIASITLNGLIVPEEQTSEGLVIVCGCLGRACARDARRSHR